MHNMEPQMDEGSTNKTTQLDLCKIKLEFPIEHNQNHHIDIPRSTSQIYSDSCNSSRSIENLLSFVSHVYFRSNKGQVSNR